MILEFAELTDNVRPAFEDLLRKTWQQTWDDELGREIIQWRYYERPGPAAIWLAMEDGQYVGMLDSVLRPYTFDGKRIMVRETADWFCLPGHRAGALGLQLLWRLRSHDEPVIVLGGSQFTVEILTKLHWAVLPSASSYVLPIKARNFVGNLIRQRWSDYERAARIVPDILSLRGPKHIAPPAGKRAIVKILAANDAVPTIPMNTASLTEMLETAHWRWLARMPHGMAEPLGILFLLDDAPVGMTVSQIEPAASGLDAKIVHVQYSNPAICAWMVSATTEILAKRGVGFVRCYVSTGPKIAAMEQAGFIKSKDVPCYWYPREWPTPASVDVSYLRGDDAMPFQALRGRVGGHHVRR